MLAVKSIDSADQRASGLIVTYQTIRLCVELGYSQMPTNTRTVPSIQMTYTVSSGIPNTF